MISRKKSLSLLFVMALAGIEGAIAVPVPARLAGTPDGCLRLTQDNNVMLDFAPAIADNRWKFVSTTAVSITSNGPARFSVKYGKDVIPGELNVVEREGKADLSWTFSSPADISFNAFTINSSIALAAMAGGTWVADAQRGVFPREFVKSGVFAGEIRSLVLTEPGGRQVALAFPKPTRVSLEDMRQWGGQSYTMRIGKGIGRMSAGERYEVAMTLAVSGETVQFHRDMPFTLAENSDWIPLKDERDIVAGSALDLSAAGLVDGPCGSQGRIIVNSEGHFACAGDPAVSKRFYGVNLCFSAQYLPKDEVDGLLDRLVRLGYNTVRIHHYESNLTDKPWKTGFDWSTQRVDQLDYLMAGCARRGLWLTTDLFVSRPIAGKQIAWPGDRVDPDLYKILVPVHEPAFKDLATFTRKFLDRVNPYTGKRVAEDPALAWVSLINEGPVANQWERVKQIPEWKAAWNRWLAKQFADRDALDMAIGDLADAEDPVAGTVALPADVRSGTRRSRLGQVFLADTERTFVERMRHLLRDELKCEALITDLNNGGPSPVPMQAARAEFDYVDDHFYIDHPNFIETPWQLPSRCSNFNPVCDGNIGGYGSAIMRVWGKPMAITEFNYAAPGRYRGIGGILTGSLAALQDWDAVWRFAYSHSDAALVKLAPMGYFDLANDPLNQAADRASLFLFLRRDLKPAPGKVAVVLPKAALRAPPSRLGLNGLMPFAWQVRVGCAVIDDPAGMPRDAITVPAGSAANSEAVASVLKAGGLDTPGNDRVIRSGTGEVTIDHKGVLTIDTPRTAGGYAEPGLAIAATNAGVKVSEVTFGATVFVSSLDQSPIRSAKRLLVTHLTDLQNTGARFGESAAQTLLDWGRLPHLVRNGAATIRLTIDDPQACTVWALSTSGRRVERVPAKVAPDGLTFVATVKGAEGACLLYEVVRQ